MHIGRSIELHVAIKNSANTHFRAPLKCAPSKQIYALNLENTPNFRDLLEKKEHKTSTMFYPDYILKFYYFIDRVQ